MNHLDILRELDRPKRIDPDAALAALALLTPAEQEQFRQQSRLAVVKPQRGSDNSGLSGGFEDFRGTFRDPSSSRKYNARRRRHRAR